MRAPSVELELANAAERQRERRYERARRDRAVLSARRRPGRRTVLFAAFVGCVGILVVYILVELVLAIPWGFGR